MKIFNFWKKKILVLHSYLLMILHWISIKSMIFWSSGLWWSFLAFIGHFGLGWIFFTKDQPLVIKSKQNRAASYNQMSKANSESKSPIYSTVMWIRKVWVEPCQAKLSKANFWLRLRLDTMAKTAIIYLKNVGA